MKVISRNCNIGYNGERYAKGIPFDVDDETGTRLIAQGTVELVGMPTTEEHTEIPAEEEFKKVGGRWKRKKS